MVLGSKYANLKDERLFRDSVYIVNDYQILSVDTQFFNICFKQTDFI